MHILLEEVNRDVDFSTFLDLERCDTGDEYCINGETVETFRRPRQTKNALRRPKFEDIRTNLRLTAKSR